MGVSNVVGDIHFDRFLLYHKFSMREKSSPKYLRGGGRKRREKEGEGVSVVMIVTPSALSTHMLMMKECAFRVIFWGMGAETKTYG